MRNGPCSSRKATMFFAMVSFSPDTRASSGAEAVLRSAPTAFTQSSTTASSAVARRRWLTSCWYWPTPMAFGSMRTSSASGSCRRRAIDTAPRSDTSSCGNSRAAELRCGINGRACLRHHHPGQRELRMPCDQLGGEGIRFARRGAVANRDELHADTVRTAPQACAARRPNRCGGQTGRWWWPPRACPFRRRRRPSRRSGCPGRAPSSRAVPRAPRAAGRAGSARTPGWLRSPPDRAASARPPSRGGAGASPSTSTGPFPRARRRPGARDSRCARSPRCGARRCQARPPRPRRAAKATGAARLPCGRAASPACGATGRISLVLSTRSSRRSSRLLLPCPATTADAQWP